MPRKTTSLPLNLPGPSGGIALYRWLYEQLRAAILEGRLHPGARLPATRDVGKTYKLSRATVVAAFEQLKSEGYVEGRTGSGTYVSRVLPEQFLHAGGVHPKGRLSHRRIVLSAYAKGLSPFHALPARPVRAFRANQSALNLFPAKLWAQVAASRLRRASAQLLAGGETLGYHPLRQAVAEYLNTSRGVRCTAEQVLIVSGALEGLDRTARLLLNPEEPAWMEEPGYPAAAAVLRAVGARICDVPVDSEGLDLERGIKRWPRPKLVYVTPAHQFPLGVAMSLRRRLALLEWARKAGVLIFEDDYDSEYRYSGRPVPALQGLDRAGVVIFGGSFSAVMFPAMRLGYLVVPPEMVDVFARAQSVSTHHPPLLGQAVLCDFIREGHFARHIRRMREVYAERLGVLLKAAEKELRGVIEISNVEAGLQTIGCLHEGFNADKVVKAAAKRDVELKSLSQYYAREKPTNGLVLGFAAVEAKELQRGVTELARLLELDESRYIRRASRGYVSVLEDGE